MISTATKESANDVKNDIKSTYYNAKQDVHDAANGAHEDLSKVVNTAGRTAREYLDTAANQLADTTEKVNTEIHANPVRSTLVAMGVGFILSSLLRR